MPRRPSGGRRRTSTAPHLDIQHHRTKPPAAILATDLLVPANRATPRLCQRANSQLTSALHWLEIDSVAGESSHTVSLGRREQTMTWLEWSDFLYSSGLDRPDLVQTTRNQTHSGSRSMAELWLIDRAYEHIAARSFCHRCGAPLNGRRTMRESNAGAEEWCLTLTTHCRGWRRHRHHALVREVADDLVLGPFR